MKKKLLFSLIVTILFAACKKDPVEPPISLMGKWTIENITSKEYDNGVLIATQTEPGDGTTVDFQSNGNVIVTSPGPIIETYPYTMPTESKVTFDGDTYDIKDLTASKVTLFIKEDVGAGDYYEVSINLKR